MALPTQLARVTRAGGSTDRNGPRLCKETDLSRWQTLASVRRPTCPVGVTTGRRTNLARVELVSPRDLEQSPEPRQLVVAYPERRDTFTGGAPGSSVGLLFLAHLHINEFAGGPQRRRKVPHGRPLVLAPNAKVQYHAGTHGQCTHCQPDEAALEDVPLSTSVAISEQREHPFIWCQPQRPVAVLDLPSPCRLASERKSHHQEQPSRRKAALV